MDHPKVNDPVITILRQIRDQLDDITNQITYLIEDEETDSGQ
jgi:hypothetical protein